MPHVTQIGSNGVQSNDQEHETQQFCTQGSLETINLGEEVASAPVAKTPKQRFQQKEDEVLIQSWLNVSKDSIVGVDQKGDSFWNRIGEAYNKHRDTNYKERKPMALKGRWHKINPSVQKFVGCYKQAVSTQQSGSSESNIMQAAYKIYFQDEGEKFIFEAAWRLLKDEPKWLAGSSEASTKRRKNSASGVYSSSYNPPTPTSSEYNPSSPSLPCRPIGQKAAKRKENIWGTIFFGEQYLRRPNIEDIERLLQMGEARGFPGMLGSIDCMHWEWKNCPVALKGQYVRGDHGKPTVMLEAVASQDLWIWHAFFGVAGSSNDINVLNQSNVFNDVLQGRAPEVHYTINHTEYNKGYYLSDGIYPEWATFVKSIPMPQGDKRKLFAQHQEGARKDIERAFGVLQSRFAIIRNPARSWHLDTLQRIMNTCIILHNMIVEDERATYGGNFDFSYDHLSNDATMLPNDSNIDFQEFLRRRFDVRDKQTHRHLQQDLIEHIWQRYGQDNNNN